MIKMLILVVLASGDAVVASKEYETVALCMSAKPEMIAVATYDADVVRVEAKCVSSITPAAYL